MKVLSNVVLVCPRNDPESALIHVFATARGIKIITSCQGVGATLEAEPILYTLLTCMDEREVWIVELPGLETEAKLRAQGFNVVLIDHHTYGKLDRSRGPDGKRLPSSLEQFFALAEIDDELIEAGMHAMNLSSKIVRGLGILDDRYAQGLRDEGYSQAEIREVLALRESLILEMRADFDKERTNALGAWQNREERGGYTIVRANSEAGIRGEVGILTIGADCDTKPLVVVEHLGRGTFVQNVDPSVVEKLRAAFGDTYNTFTFGAGRCWGTDRKADKPAVPVSDVFAVLGL